MNMKPETVNDAAPTASTPAAADSNGIDRLRDLARKLDAAILATRKRLDELRHQRNRCTDTLVRANADRTSRRRGRR